MSFITSEHHFINYLNASLKKSQDNVIYDNLLPVAFYIEHVYKKGLADRFTWSIKTDGAKLLEEKNVLEWLQEHSYQSYIAQINFRCQPTKEFLGLIEDLTNTQGLYSFWNKNDIPLYVGMSIDLGSRITSSFKRFEVYNRQVYIKHIITQSVSDTALLEVYFISTLKPSFNVTGKHRDALTLHVEPIPEWSRPVLCDIIIINEDKEQE